MDKTLFNLHDLVLLLIAFECIAVALYIGFNRPKQSIPTTLLIAFFAVHAGIALNELVLWGSTFRYWVLEASPNFFFILDFTYWLDGPLLFLFICAITRNHFSWQRWHGALALPVVVFAIFIYFHFYALPYEQKYSLIKDYTFADFNYVMVDLIAKFIRVVLAGLSVHYLLKAEPQVTQKFNVPVWLPKILMAFTGILIWEMLLSVLKVYHSLYVLPNYDIVEYVGLASYYMQFGLINTVLFMAASHFLSAGTIKPKPAEKEPVNMAIVEKLEATMKAEQPYLNQNLSFERLAEKLDIPVKELSNTINRYYEVNFYEFINNYRIQEAKRLLEDPAQFDKSITDVFYDAGFNSKSVYNTLFKKRFNKTPSQYRKDFKQQLAKQIA